MDRLVLIVSAALSCFIIVHILFQYLNDRFVRVYKNRSIYIISEFILVVVMTFVNLVGNPKLNLITWICLVGFIAVVLYSDLKANLLRRVLECEVLLVVMTIFEGLAALIIDFMLNILDINIVNMTMRECIEIMFSKILIIFAYYMIANRFFIKNISVNKTLYAINFIVFVYSFFNMLIIAEAFQQGETNLYLIINMGCIILAVLFLLHFIKIANEKNILEYEYKMLEKQTDIQYKYYLEQEKKYNKTVQILHDVNKHITTIEQLYANGNIENANEYTRKIVETLKPLIPTRYIGNPILDILLTDKKILANEKIIDFDIKIDNIDINFVDSVDLITIFGNLLDNAIEACEYIDTQRKIILELEQHREMLVIRIKNTYKDIKWKNGVPISEKGKERGIGLNNVKRCIEKYDGTINFKEKDNYFVVDIFLNP